MKNQQTHNIIAAVLGGVIVYLFIGGKNKPTRRNMTNFKEIEKSYIEGYEDAKKDYGIKG